MVVLLRHSFFLLITIAASSFASFSFSWKPPSQPRLVAQHPARRPRRSFSQNADYKCCIRLYSKLPIDDDDEDGGDKYNNNKAALIDNNNSDNNNKIEVDIDAFLDTPFYDPDKVLQDDNSSETSKNIAKWVKNDYETAETIIAGIFFVVLIIVAQEVVRSQMHGTSYVPFTSSGGGGKLF